MVYICVPEDMPVSEVKSRYDAIIKDIEEAHKRNQPILVGTTSIEKSEILATLLKEKTSLYNKIFKKYNDLEKNYTKLKEDYSILNKKKSDLDLKYQEKIISFNTINDEYSRLLNIKNNLVKQNKEMLEKIKLIEPNNNELKIKVNDLLNNLKKYQEENDTMKKLVEETKSKFGGAISHFENMDNELKAKEVKLKEYSKYKEENKKLKEEKENYQKVIQNNQTKEDYLVKPEEQYYDVVIDINSINSLRNEGWAIKYNKERKEIYEKIVGEQTIKIGVLGLNNVGKSFLLSKLVRAEIPTGYSIETKGISIKYAKEEDTDEEKGICILDSAGFETPLLKGEKKKIDKKMFDFGREGNKSNELENAIKYDEIEDELSRDKAQTERFIEQLIISLSDMIILVIGKLTRTEQRLITRIKNLSKKNEKNKIKSIIIVHNLAQYHKIKEVERHIEQYLTKSATFELSEKNVIGIPKFQKRKYFFENSDESDDIQIYHYIMAKEGTEAGDYYNPLTLELIKRQYNSFNKRYPINIPDEIINLFSELSSDIIGEKMECQKTGTDKNIIKLADMQINNLKRKKQIKLQSAYIDQDGNYLKNMGKFEPKYSLYYYKEKKRRDDNSDEDEDEEGYEKYLLLRLEIPGNIVKLTARTTDPKTEKVKGIVIKGMKKLDDFKEKSKEDFTTISDNRSYDEFTYLIVLQRNLELSKSGASGNTSIYEIQFDKRNKEKYFQKENAQNNDPQKDNEIKENMEDSKFFETKDKSKEAKLINIASGVYVMKFQLTERSYIPNK